MPGPAPVNPFFIVWCPTSPNPPTVKHESAERAEQEAERLARQYPGEDFHVLTVIGTATWSPIKWQRYIHDEIPF